MITILLAWINAKYKTEDNWLFFVTVVLDLMMMLVIAAAVDK